MSKAVSFLLLFFLFVSSANDGNAQAKKWEYQRDKHQWTTAFPEDVQLNPAFANEDLVVLQEYTEFRVHEYSLNTIIHRRELIKVLSEAGVRKLSYFKLPPELDPIWERDKSDINRQVRYQKIPLLNGELLTFGARKKTAENKVQLLEPRDSVGIRIRTHNSTAEQHYDFYHLFEELEPGDVVEIEYKMFFPFIVDRSNESNFTLQTDIYTSGGLFDNYRIFFHGINAKQDLTFDLVFPSNEYYLLFEENDLPEGIKKVRSSKPYTTSYRWQFPDLPACMSETGIRPHKDLPFVQFYRHNRKYGKWSDFDLLEYKPYDWFLMSRPQMRFKTDHLRMFGGVSAKEKVLSKFFAKRVLGKVDTLSKVLSIHNYINEEMDYKEDSFWYMGVDNRLERIKWHLKKGIFREISRFSIYDGMMNRLGADYYHAFISDKRIAEISPELWQPVLGMYRIYALSVEDDLTFLFPKNKDVGFKLGELPFYLSGTTAWSVCQNADNRFDPGNILFANSPQANGIENRRKIYSEALYDPANDGCYFQTEVTLGGQFSTMTRGIYRGERFEDETVNPLYMHRIDNISEQTEFLEAQSTKTEEQFPFKTEIDLSYFEPQFFEGTSGADSLRIPLSNLFPHIYEVEIDKERALPFYTDFPQQDDICYTFHLPDSTSLVKSPNLAMSGDRWSYQFVAIMRDRATLELCSRLLLDREKLDPKEYREWRKVISFLKMLGEEEIVLTIAVD